MSSSAESATGAPEVEATGENNEPPVNEENYHYVDIHSANPGNPIFTLDSRISQEIPCVVSPISTKEPASEEPHPIYTTTASAYGSMQPTVEAYPSSFHGKSQKFTEHLAQSGMYRNHSLNTSMDRSYGV